MDDRAILVDHHIFSIGEQGAILPLAHNPLLLRAAVDGVHDDSSFNRSFAGTPVIDRSLSERLNAGDEDRPKIMARAAPCQALERGLDDPTAILLAAIGFQFEKLLGNLI